MSKNTDINAGDAVKALGVWCGKRLLILVQLVSVIPLMVEGLWISNVWYPEEKVKYQKLFPTEWYDAPLFWLLQWTPWIVIITIVLIMYGTYHGRTTQIKNEKKIGELEQEVASLEQLRPDLEEAQQTISYLQDLQETSLYRTISNYLAHLSKDHLKFEATERISLYLHNGHEFILAGRYSKNQEFTKPRRKAFSHAEGCIGKTWRDGNVCFEKLPKDESEYFDYLKNDHHIDKGKAKSIRMKSRVCCGYPLKENFENVGVLIFESLNRDALIENDLRRHAAEHECYLIAMLKEIREVTTMLESKNEGAEDE